MSFDQHPYCYPSTDVLRNKHDIRDKGVLEALERQLSMDRLTTMPRDLPITVTGFREIHRYMLQDVYDWAGKYRTVNTGRTAPFCRIEYIAVEMRKRFASIRRANNLRHLTAEQFAERASVHINEINAIHPFLDGNGRTQRAFLEILGDRAGHEIDLARIEPRAWNIASIRGFHKQDYDAMRAVIAGALAQSPNQMERARPKPDAPTAPGGRKPWPIS